MNPDIIADVIEKLRSQGIKITQLDVMTVREMMLSSEGKFGWVTVTSIRMTADGQPFIHENEATVSEETKTHPVFITSRKEELVAFAPNGTVFVWTEVPAIPSGHLPVILKPKSWI